MGSALRIWPSCIATSRVAKRGVAVSAAHKGESTAGAKQGVGDCQAQPVGDCRAGSRYAAKDGTRDGSAADSAPAIDLRSRVTLRAHEAARVLGVSDRCFRATVARELPCIRRGKGLVLYSTAGLMAWAEREAKVERDEIKGIVAEALSRI
jgi:hypothetical protein